MYGWEDENHDWRFIGNFTTTDGVHPTYMRLGLYQCSICGNYMMGRAQGKKEYVTPMCKDGS